MHLKTIKVLNEPCVKLNKNAFNLLKSIVLSLKVEI